jgi:hypothetical protein
LSNLNVNALENNLRTINNNINLVQDQVQRVESQVGSMSRDLTTVTTELLELRQEFSQFVQAAERTANIQRSETKLGSLKDDLEREYGHYSLVRRTSIGTLQAFDIGNVSDRTVQQISEELMIQTPRYWLAPALVALAAWSRDDESLAEKSVEAAFSRDSAKTSLFFALVLRRQGRLDGATRWLRHYFTSLDPRALTREFGVVLEAAAQEAFGPAGRDLILGYLVEWSEILRDDPAIVEQQVELWQTEISVHRGRVDDSLYPRLSVLSPQWAHAKNVLEHASALGNVTERYQAIHDSNPPINHVLEDKMDDLLEILVTEYDEEELPLRREIVFHEAVIDSAGDMVRAREAADFAVAALEETLDAVSLVTHAALHPELLGIGDHTRKLAIGANKTDFETATGRYTRDYRASHMSHVDIELGPNHSNYATALGFTSWKVSTGAEQLASETSLDAAWDAVVRDYIERTKFKYTALVIPVLVTIGVTALGFVFGWVGALIAFLVTGGIFAFRVWSKKKAADAAVADAIASRDAATAVSREIYRDAMAEWVDAEIAYRTEDAKEQDLLRVIAQWPSIRIDKKDN